jgi:hypothetical protein
MRSEDYPRPPRGVKPMEDEILLRLADGGRAELLFLSKPSFRAGRRLRRFAKALLASPTRRLTERSA